MIHLPHDVKVNREGDMVVLVIVGAGVLKMPADAAHAIALALMRVVGEIERETLP